MFYPKKFDVIVIGGGHAGTEAALAAARMGATTLLLTHNIDTLGHMSCNPSIGGIGKSHLVKEIDALGGMMAKAIDLSGIQFRILNSSKGPAVHSTRAQADRLLYQKAVYQILRNQENLSVFQQSVDDLIIKNDQALGVITEIGLNFLATTIILTVGTFLGGKIHIGSETFQGGRAGEKLARKLTKNIRKLPFKIARLKTGTPPRLDKRSVNFKAMEVQSDDKILPYFSFFSDGNEHPKQLPCYITYTNQKTHNIILNNLNRSAIYSGKIEGVGPRYCPSIEDKIIRFSDKERHQVFVEPEGLNSFELYPNGISTSLPFDIQLQFIHSIKGFESAHITRPGYAIEYDFFDPRGLRSSFETKYIKNLFFAGQINGTTGYEEAAAQGLIAGINAALTVQNKPNWSPKRSESYIGVLIDDLITQGTKEPYRMFTSRAEYRLTLREDNADIRLSPKAIELGLLSSIDKQKFLRKKVIIEEEIGRLKSQWIMPATDKARRLDEFINSPIQKRINLFDLLKRPNINYKILKNIYQLRPFISDVQIIRQIEITSKYSGYIDRQNQEINAKTAFETCSIPLTFDYCKVNGLSSEVQQKLIEFKPSTLGAASRISGVTPAAISLLTIYMKKIGLIRRKNSSTL